MLPVDGSAEKRDALLASARQAVGEHRRRVAEARAREHVGAAGWAQTSMLEAIIRAGREGSAAVDALRQVVSLTTEQVRTLPLGAPGEAREVHAQALSEIVHSGEEQISAAEALDDLVCHALAEVTRTPVAEVNVQALRRIHEWLQGQVGALETITGSARAQADTLEQISRLERVSAEHQERVEATRHLSARERVQVLGDLGEEVVGRIAELDEANAHQLDALGRIGEAVVEKVAETGTTPSQQVQALEALAQAVQDKAEELRER
ncbi:hypothetical protein DAETH_24780 [Deinococcus aetherius]|uniref:Uncharacterized protein n=1 Tax=Deinococcus aetherius TaxID=200252 RepID=A0ABM8AFE4_9DEIO|nr:hypothetical protein [Deinococcus aetherius]BDP42509.1 hypothetical protein DAETH_24780 [Deinococcus aetherius]